MRCSQRNSVAWLGVLLLLVCAAGLVTSACKNKIGTAGVYTRSSGESSNPGPLTPGIPAEVKDDGGSTKMNGPGAIVSLAEFVYPLVNGYNNSRSMWCACRSIGTSPHIGQDIVADSALIAVAHSDSKVTKITFDSSCGYAVWVQDPNGALWRYLHLNKPAVLEGQTLASGQKIANLGDYPRGCGTGPHLHLERRSSSRAVSGDRETGKSCGNGYSSCYFDPNILSVARKVSSPSAVLALTGADAQESASSLSQVFDDVRAPRMVDVAKDGACATLQPNPWGLSNRKVPEQELPPVFERRSREESAAPLVIESDLQRREDGIRWVKTLRIRLATMLGTTHAPSQATGEQAAPLSEWSNRCGITSGEGPECITEFRLVVGDGEGQWFSLFENTGTRNLTPEVTSESRVCFPPEAKRFGILVRTNRANSYFVSEDLGGNP